MTTVRVHHCDGTADTASSATAEGFDSLTGTAPNYVAGGHSGTAIRFPGGSANFYRDNLTAQYVGLYVRVPQALAGGCNIVLAQSDANTVASCTVNQNGTLKLTSSLGSTQATSTAALTVGQWSRIEWHVGSSTQELRLFLNPDATSPDETLTGATVEALTRYMFGTAWAANENGPVDLDEITIADSWPNMASAASSTTAWDGTTWVPVKAWDGTAWVPVKAWDGTAWV